MDAQQLRALAEGLMAKLMDKDQEIHFKQTKIDLLTHEIARYKRLQFAAKSEHLQANQRSLLDETLDADLAALEAELQALSPAPAEPADASKAKPRRAPLPAHLPRVEISHEPENTQCGCGCQMKRIGEDVSEKLDYTPGTFTVERHVRGKWACVGCQKLIQAPVPAQIIDKGIPTSNLLADVLVAKYGDHLPLYRLEDIYARAGAPLPRSTLAQWVGQCGVQLRPLVDALKAEMMAHAVLHADETPVEMLKPGTGKTHKAYLWAYSPGVFEPMKAVVYDFADSRSGGHARAFLSDWRGSLICDDYGGYKASFANGITEVGCMAHARRKFFDLHANGTSQIAGQALQTIGCCTTSSERCKTSAPRSTGHPPGQVTAHCRCAARLDAGAAQPGGPRRRHGQGAGLQPQDGGRRSRASSTTAGCPSTTTGSRTRCGPLPLGARTGCLRARCWQASARPPS
jgi:transposase